jgi:hypothetical protein
VKFTAVALCILVVAASLCAGVRAANLVSGQILDYQKGYVVLTTGDSYPVATSVQISGAQQRQNSALKPAPGVFVQLTLGPDGTVTSMTLSTTTFAEATGSPQPSSSALPPLLSGGQPPVVGEFAPVTFTVLVPSSTLPGDQIFLTTSETSWNPNAVYMNRVDARHFSVIIQVPIGTKFLYLYTRGSPQSIERAASGLQREPRSLMLESVEPQQQRDTIDHWGDEAGTSLLPPPQTFPTPYNPAPYPNLPPSPHP